MKFKIKPLQPNVKLPTYAHPGDVGMDLYSPVGLTLHPGERTVVMLGFAAEFEIGYAALVTDKSSLPKNAGIHTMGGVYDAGYRGEYNVQLINLGQEKYTISAGDKIAQLIIHPIIIADIEFTDSLSDSSRGTGGFGSTGKQ